MIDCLSCMVEWLAMNTTFRFVTIKLPLIFLPLSRATQRLRFDWAVFRRIQSDWCTWNKNDQEVRALKEHCNTTNNPSRQLGTNKDINVIAFFRESKLQEV